MQINQKDLLPQIDLDRFNRVIEEDTWDKGLPKVYLDGDGWIVKHWKCGKIEQIKKIN